MSSEAGSPQDRASRLPPGVETLAAIDLGSHSFHLIVTRLQGEQMVVLDRMRERIRLAAGLDADRNLTPEAIARAVDCLRRFGERVATMPRGSVRAVGTNTLRQARNAAVFLERAEEALGHPIEIISGREEARLIHLGVSHSTPDTGGRRLVIDIGGGSTECILGHGFDILEADSLYMGCVGYSTRFFADGTLDEAKFAEAELAAELEIEPVVAAYRRLGWSRVLGCSGTILAVAAILRENGWSSEGVSSAGLLRLRRSLIDAGTIERLALPGLSEDRRPVIAGGVAILVALFRRLGLEQLDTARGALREGALYDLLGRIRQEDVRERTIQGFEEHYRSDRDHAGRVEETALELLSQVRDAWSPADPDVARAYLRWASRLFEIGLALSHTGYHKHGAYLVEHSYMAGFSRGDQLALAALVLTSRRRFRGSAFDAIEPARRADVRMLAILFRLAAQLRRSREPEAPPVSMRIEAGPRIRLAFPAGWLARHPLTLATIEEEARFLAEDGVVLECRGSDDR